MTMAHLKISEIDPDQLLREMNEDIQSSAPEFDHPIFTRLPSSSLQASGRTLVVPAHYWHQNTDGEQFIVIKFTNTDTRNLEDTYKAMNFFNGVGMARIGMLGRFNFSQSGQSIDYMFMEMLNPDENRAPATLWRHGKIAESCDAIDTVLRQLHAVSAIENFPDGTRDFSFRGNSIRTLLQKDWFRSASLTSYMLDAAEIQTEFEQRPDSVLLHGDAHHWNIVFCQTRNEYVAIDPSPYLTAGPACYDYAASMANPYDPSKEGFDDEERILSTEAMLTRAALFAENKDNPDQWTRDIIAATFLNAAQVTSRRLLAGTPEGQVSEEYWSKVMVCAHTVLKYGF
jgi:streptomycin 6-kinase